LSPNDLYCDTSIAICTVEAGVSKIVADALRLSLPKTIVATDIHGIVFNSSISYETGSSGTEWTLSAYNAGMRELKEITARG
jgi:hypothetical protein